MKLGVTIPNIELGIEPEPIRALAQAAETLGYDYLMAYDHVVGADISVRPDWHPFDGKPPIYTIDDSFHEPMVLYGFIAAVTTRIGLATGVVIMPQRQTVLLAKQAAEIDILSGGRLRLGVGVGRNDVEYAALGMNFHDRGQRSVEQIELMRRLWTERSVTIDGKWHRIEAAGINPLPIQRPIPIWLGGAADVVLKRVATIGDGWYVPSYLNEEQIREHLDRLYRHAESAGHDPASIGVEGIIRMWGRTPERSAESIAMWRRLGATHVTFNTESDSYRSRLPSAQMELQGKREDYLAIEERIEALARFIQAAKAYLD